MEPQAIALEAGRWIEPLDIELVQPRAETVHVVGERAEREMLKLLSRPFAQNAPAMIEAVGTQVQRSAPLPHVEAEVLVEALGLTEIRNRQTEVIEGVYAQRVRASRRRNEASDLCHGFLQQSFSFFLVRRHPDGITSRQRSGCAGRRDPPPRSRRRRPAS